MKEFRGINHGREKIGISVGPQFVEMKPTVIHLKEDGTLTDEPSLCIEMERGSAKAFGQISLKMFNDGLEDIGYKLVKI